MKLDKTHFWIGFAIAIVGLIGTAYVKGLFTAQISVETLGTLSDCFLVPAIFVGGVGCLSWISTLGGYDMLKYGGKQAFGPFVDLVKGQKSEPVSYYNYQQQLKEKRKPWLKEFLVIGLACLLIAIVFIVLYSLL